MDDFFGRSNYLEVINKRVEGLKSGYRQNLAIIGDEAIGKTSLITHFLKNFCDTRIVPVYLEIRQEPFDYFARRFIGVMLHNFLKDSGIVLKEDLDFLITKSRRFIPDTVNRITDILSSLDGKKENVLYDLFSLPQLLASETSKSSVVIFDEFHNLENLRVKNLYKVWSKALISHRNTMFIIISSRKFQAKKIISNNLALLFGNFEILDIESFDPKTSEDFIRYALRPVELPRPYRHFLVHFTGGHPYYLKVICEGLIKTLAYKKEELCVPEGCLVETLENLMFEEMGLLHTRFSNYLKGFGAEGLNHEHIAILCMIASGHNRIKDLACALHKQRKNLLPELQRLIELDIIEHNGDFFKISDRLFNFWLRFVYHEKATAFSLEANKQKALFRSKITDQMKEFMDASYRPVLVRIAELLHSFGDETIRVDKKRIKLSQFREIKPLKFQGRLIKDGLLGRSCDGLWILAFKEGQITEEDVAEFVAECRKYKKNRLQRKIMFSSDNIDSNAKLKALEEKIWAWDPNNINFILDLYNKPRIIA